MAKEKPNKSAAIRSALEAHPEKTPVEISALLKTQGLKISPTYVSNVKHHMLHKGKKRRKAQAVRKAVRHVGNGSYEGVGAALEFVKSAGGLAAAKAALDTLEEIGKVL